jgi:hypothetical protein
MKSVPVIGTLSADSDRRLTRELCRAYFASWKMIPRVKRVPRCTRLTP